MQLLRLTWLCAARGSKAKTVPNEALYMFYYTFINSFIWLVDLKCVWNTIVIILNDKKLFFINYNLLASLFWVLMRFA